jgi:hypothetical protein
MMDPAQMAAAAELADGDSALARSVRQVLRGLDDPNGVLSAFDSFAPDDPDQSDNAGWNDSAGWNGNAGWSDAPGRSHHPRGTDNPERAGGS